MPKNCPVLGGRHPPWYPEPCSPTAPWEVHLPRMKSGQAPWAKCQMLSSSWKGWGPGMTRHPGLKRKKVVPLLTQLLLPSGKQGDPRNKHSSLWTPAFSLVKGRDELQTCHPSVPGVTYDSIKTEISVSHYNKIFLCVDSIQSNA